MKNEYDEIKQLFPLIVPRGSDSAAFDNALEFLMFSGYSLAQAMMMMEEITMAPSAPARR